LLSKLSESVSNNGNASLRHSPAHAYDIYEDQLVLACYSRSFLSIYLSILLALEELLYGCKIRTCQLRTARRVRYGGGRPCLPLSTQLPFFSASYSPETAL